MLSPALFAVYLDDLSLELTESKIGCKINDIIINHLVYADDTILICPSPLALQKLINICEYVVIANTKYFSGRQDQSNI